MMQPAGLDLGRAFEGSAQVTASWRLSCRQLPWSVGRAGPREPSSNLNPDSVLRPCSGGMAAWWRPANPLATPAAPLASRGLPTLGLASPAFSTPFGGLGIRRLAVAPARFAAIAGQNHLPKLTTCTLLTTSTDLARFASLRGQQPWLTARRTSAIVANPRCSDCPHHTSSRRTALALAALPYPLWTTVCSRTPVILNRC